MTRIHLKPICFATVCAASIFSSAFGTDLRELTHFIKEFWQHPAQVGAVVPCMPAVGKELTKYIAQFQKEHPHEPLHILEVGAGTGPITSVIVSMLRSGFGTEGESCVDTLDAVEISPEFCEELHKKFDGYSNVKIQCVSILDWAPSYKYDFIISTLPFNSFPFDVMNGIINRLKCLIKPDGILSYVAYAGIAQAKKPFLWGERKREHIAKMDVLREFREQYEIENNLIVRNMPPINVYHLRIRKN